jgi:hypothetical protein
MSGHPYFIITRAVRARPDLKSVIWARSERELHHGSEILQYPCLQTGASGAVSYVKLPACRQLRKL